MAERGGELREQEMRKNAGGLMKARASKSGGERITARNLGLAKGRAHRRCD
jgi:hypothetical protein